MEPPVGWTVLMPFKLMPGRVLEEGTVQVLGHAWELRTRGDWYCLTTVGLESIDCARAIVPRLAAILQWAYATAGEGIRVDSTIQDVTRFERPRANVLPNVLVDGVADEGRPVVHEDGERIAFVAAGSLTVSMHRPIDSFNRLLADAEGHPGIEALMRDTGRLAHALEVFLAGAFEQSMFARFMNDMTVLEILKTQPTRDEPFQTLVRGWVKELEALAEREHLPEGEVASLRSSLEWLTQRSIGQSIEELGTNVDRAPEARDLYKIRSKAVHEGNPSAIDAAQRRAGELRDLVRAVLVHEVEKR